MAIITPSSKRTHTLKSGNSTNGPSHVEMSKEDHSAKAPASSSTHTPQSAMTNKG